MTALQTLHGPFALPAPIGYALDYTQTCCAEDRIRLVRASSDPEWLRAVIKDRDMQTTVRLAAERRLRKLNK